jgi:hypothetical protein
MLIVLLITHIVAFSVAVSVGAHNERDTFQQAKQEYVHERMDIMNAGAGAMFLERATLSVYLCNTVTGFTDNKGCVECHKPDHGGEYGTHN